MSCNFKMSSTNYVSKYIGFTFHIEGYKDRTLILLLIVFLNVGLILYYHYYFVKSKKNRQNNYHSVNNNYQIFLLVLCYN